MPNVDGKKYPYTPAGKAAAKAAKNFTPCATCANPMVCKKMGRCAKGMKA